MDAKDLRTQTTINERSNDGRNKYSPIDNAVQYDRNKPYQDIGSNSLPKVDVHNITRPCAVIGPDRVVPTETTDTYLKKGKIDSWMSLDNYCCPPDYAQKICSYQAPTRNISPRQTFQENMQRIMVPPRYSAPKVSDEFSEKAANQSKNLKLTHSIPEIKYCEVPYPVNAVSNEQKSIIDPSVTNAAPPTIQNGSWPIGNMTSHASRRPFDNPEIYQFPDYSNCTDSKTLPVSRLLRTVREDINHSYTEPHYPAGNIRYKPYSTKDRYPPPRYELAFPNSYHPPPPFPYNKYDTPKPVPPHPYVNYPQTHLKYIDNRPIDHVFEGYVRPIQHTNYSTPVRNQLTHPPYMPVPSNCLQNKFHQYPTDINSYKPANKGQYDHSKILEYENARNRVYHIPENYYPKEISRSIPVKSQMVPNFPNANSVHLQHMHVNHLYRKDLRNYEYYQHFKHAADPSINNHMSRLPSQFSPKAIPISPCGSLSSETIFPPSNIQEDCGYASQSSTTSTKSMDSRISHDLYRRYDYRYGSEFRPSNSKTDLSSNNLESRNKKDIDVRQFLQMWKDGDEESENNNSEFVTQAASISMNNSQKLLESDKTKDQLYVLGLVDVPSEELAKYEHIQKVSKLPDNIKGYNNIELLYQFEEVIQSSNLATNNKDKPPFQSEKQMTHILSQTRLPRSVSPLDVEAKISQSVIHKEVGCNFEIKPCSPKMLSVEVATPVQSIVSERIIEKVTNPNIPKSPAMLLQHNKDFDNYAAKKQEILQPIKETEIPSCKMVDDCAPNDTTHSIKNNYSLQDLEGSSGVCLASLPRLDNDIELNFPEVNQQFINANKLELCVSQSSPKTFTCLDQPQNDVSKEIVNKQISSDTYRISNNSNETSFNKLSKFRKTKINAFETKERDPLICAQTMRTDSVIIKNPDNIRNYERSCSPYTNQIGGKHTKPINLSAQTYQSFEDLDCNVIQSSAKEVIDFSLNSSMNHEPSDISDENITNIENSSTSFEIFEQNEIKDTSEANLDSATLCDNKNESHLRQKDHNCKTSNTQYNSTEAPNKNLIEYNNFNTLHNPDNLLLESTQISNKEILTENCDKEISLETIVNEQSKILYQGNSGHSSEIELQNSEKDILTCESSVLINNQLKNVMSDNSGISEKRKLRKCETDKQILKNTNENSSKNSIEIEVSVSDKSNFEKEEKERDNINSSLLATHKHFDDHNDDHNKQNPNFDIMQTLANTNASNLNEGFCEVLLQTSLAEKKVTCLINPDTNANSTSITHLKELLDNSSMNENITPGNINKNNIESFEPTSAIANNEYRTNNESVNSKIITDESILEISKDTQRTQTIDDSFVPSNIIMKNVGILNCEKNEDDEINRTQVNLLTNNELDIYSGPEKDKEDNNAVEINLHPACDFDAVINNKEKVASIHHTNVVCKEKSLNTANGFGLILRSKESFFPWIQNLFLYQEGSCVTLRAAKMGIEKSSDMEFKTDHENINLSSSECLEAVNEDFFPETNNLSNDKNPVEGVIDRNVDCTENVIKNQSKSEICLGLKDNAEGIERIKKIKSLKEIVLNMISKNNIQTTQVSPKKIVDDQKSFYINEDNIVCDDIEQENKSRKKYEIFDKTKLKQKNKLKRSLSDSALHIYNCREDNQSNDFSVISPKKRRTNDIKIPINNFETQIIPQNLCNIIQNTRRNSIATFDDGENVSFCILIDNDYIIDDESDNVCFPDNENPFVNICVNNSNSEEITLISEEKQSLYEYSDEGIIECTEDKSVDDSWVNDVACVETVITVENTSEEAGADELSSPKAIVNEFVTHKVVDHSDHESDAGIFSSDISDHTNKMKLFYGDQMWGDDANLVEQLYRMPQMEVNKTLLDRESQNTDDYRYYDKDSLEKVLSEPHYYKTTSDYEGSESGDILTPLQLDDNENKNIDDSIQDNLIVKQDNESVGKQKVCLQKQETGIEKLDTEINSCESSIDDVYIYNREDSILKYPSSSSPEVSSTTSEEKNSSILLKITNYNGARISEVSDNTNTDRIRCKYTENNKYLYNSSKKTLLTKAAQKYIPPLEESISDLKVRLPLPPKSLNKLQQLKTTKQTLKIESLTHEDTNVSKKYTPKKQKQNFGDVLRSIDEIQIKMQKEKSKKSKKCIPKMVIKKNGNGSHYASTSNHSYNPDLTGRKWQPWVFIEKSRFIDKMALRKKARAIFNHRKKTFVLTENYYKYRAESSSKQFFIAQPKSDDSSQGLLKCTIRLKHDV